MASKFLRNILTASLLTGAALSFPASALAEGIGPAGFGGPSAPSVPDWRNQPFADPAEKMTPITAGDLAKPGLIERAGCAYYYARPEQFLKDPVSIELYEPVAAAMRAWYEVLQALGKYRGHGYGGPGDRSETEFSAAVTKELPALADKLGSALPEDITVRYLMLTMSRHQRVLENEEVGIREQLAALHNLQAALHTGKVGDELYPLYREAAAACLACHEARSRSPFVLELNEHNFIGFDSGQNGLGDVCLRREEKRRDKITAEAYRQKAQEQRRRGL